MFMKMYIIDIRQYYIMGDYEGMIYHFRAINWSIIADPLESI